MKCEKCGNMLNEGVEFCPYCGAKIEINSISDEQISSIDLSQSELEDNNMVDLPLIEEQPSQIVSEISNEEPLMESTVTALEQTNMITEESLLETINESSVIEQPINVEGVKKQSSKAIMAIIGILIIVVAIIFGYMYISKPKTRFLTASNNAYKEFVKMMDKSIDSKTMNLLKNNIAKINYDVNIGFNMKDDTMGLNSYLNDMNLKADLIVDSKNNKNYFDVILNKEKEELINANIYTTSNKTYFKIKDVLDNYVWNNSENKDLFKNINTDDYKYLGNKVKNAIFSQLKDNNFKKSNATLKLDNEDKKFTKISLNITEKLVNNIQLKVLNDIKNDKKSIKIISDMTSTNEKEIIKSLSETIKYTKEEKTTNNAMLKYSLYVKGYNDVVKYALEIPGEYGDSQLSLLNYKNEDKKMLKQLELISGGNPVATISFLESSNNKYKITGNLLGMAEVTGSYLLTNTNADMNIKVVTSYDNSEYNLSYNYNLKEVTKNKKFITDGKLSLTSKTYEEETMNFSLDFILNEEIGVKFPSVDVKDSKNISNLTEEEQNMMTEKMMQLPLVNMFMMGLPSANNVQYDDSSNYEYNNLEYQY
jgi:rRNA maturation endonuclease Nob1